LLSQLSKYSLTRANPELKEDEMPAAQDPIRAQLIEARRNQILDAAAQVFAEKGFHRATTREIASTAGISEGTIYNYFDSKEDLMVGLMTRLAGLETLDEELTEALHGDLRDFFVTVYRHRLDFVDQAQEMVLAVLPEVLINPRLRERFYQRFVLRAATSLERYVQTRIDMGHIRPVEASLAARALHGAFVGLLLFRVLGDEAVLAGWDDCPEVLAAIFLDGLRPRTDEEGGMSR
jgi:AcrR family transcriptional regulator